MQSQSALNKVLLQNELRARGHSPVRTCSADNPSVLLFIPYFTCHHQGSCPLFSKRKRLQSLPTSAILRFLMQRLIKSISMTLRESHGSCSFFLSSITFFSTCFLAINFCTVTTGAFLSFFSLRPGALAFTAACKTRKERTAGSHISSWEQEKRGRNVCS